MEKQFKKAMQIEILKSIASNLYDLWVELGKPEEPTGPSTDVKGQIAQFADISSMGDGATEEDVEKYNNKLETLYELVGYTHIGSGIWHTQYESGSEAWQEYKEKGTLLIDDFTNYELWDLWISQY